MTEEQLFSRYKERRKIDQGDCWWERDPSNFEETPHGLFPPNPKETQDQIAHIFYSAKSFSEVWEKLSNVVDQETLVFFQNFFATFSPKITKILPEKALYHNYASYLNKLLKSDAILLHLAQIEQFYQVNPMNHQAYILWQPRKNGFAGASDGHHLFLKLPHDALPITDNDLHYQLAAVLIHEATHSYSARASDEFKQFHTKAFLEGAGSAIQNEPFIFALEEPLVQALSQALYFKKHHPILFDLPDCWFHHPLAKEYLALVEPFFEANSCSKSSLFFDFGQSYRSFHSLNKADGKSQ